jgi:hypothetical protein
MNDAPFQDRPPITDRVNAYDEKHLAIYVRLLMAEEFSASIRPANRIVPKSYTTAISPVRDGCRKPDIVTFWNRECSELHPCHVNCDLA